LKQILSGRIGQEEYLAFLRRQVKEGPEKYRRSYRDNLFHALLQQPWTQEYEDEAFGLLETLSEAKEPVERLRVHVENLHRLTDRMVRARYDALMAKVEHQEKLTRIELRDKRAENLKAARTGFADRLKKAGRKHSDAMAAWMLVERLYLDVLLERNLDRVAEECWEIVGAKPKKLSEKATALEAFDRIRQGRCFVMLTNLAVRKSAKPELAQRLLGYINDGLEADPKNDGWRLTKYRLLVALDRPKELEKDLRAWVREDDPSNAWRVSLAYLLAEQGKIKEAIRLLEAVKADDELGPAQFRTLADWYMVVDRREDHERALIAVYKMMDEWRMSNWLSQRLQPWRRSDGRLPSELDKNVLRMFAALFEKSGSPGNHLSYLQQFYQATHDFRLLEVLADGVVGHTAARVYPFLQRMTSVLNEVRDEATADSIVEHLAEVRQRAKTDVDRRALDLLEMLVERRAAEIQNQPGPHIEKALAAMQRAFKREWTAGEPRLMAELLASLGRISQQSLADEQIRQLQVLHRDAEKGSIDRLYIAHAFARTYWSYSRYNEAIDLLESALAEYQRACDGVLPSHVNGPLDTFVSYLEQRSHHARGEAFLFAQLEHPSNRQQRFYLVQRLYRLYENALANDGHVSLGKGAELYKAVEAKIRDAMKTTDQNHRYTLVNQLCTIYRTAHRKKIAGVIDDLKDFAFKQIPDLLKRQTNNYQSVVSVTANTLHDLAGPLTGLHFLIERIEAEPPWFRFNNQDGWSQFSWSLAYWRHQAKDIGDLDGRLLKIVLAELRRDLESRRARGRAMYNRHSSYYWKEKEADFLRTAEEVYAERKGSGESVKYIAEYFYHGLDRFDRAIEILFIALKEKILDESGQSRLVQFLHWQKRFGESIAVLLPLVETRPDNLQYRVWLMHAYFQTKRQAELLALLKQTDEYFHQNGRWTEHAMATLARSCLSNQLYKQSAAYYEEVIPLHQRTHPRRGIGNGTLSTYYAGMADAYIGLKDTAKAVDAACGAIVSWGRRLDNRRGATGTLKRVLSQSPDLDAFVAELDKQAAETGLHNPIVRKALGMVYSDGRQYDKAIVQLRLACEVQPNDTETHKTLVACFDKQDDKQGAIGQLLASLQLSRRNIQLYQDLGRRFGELERPLDKERAYTSIVEVLPSESESHTLLAEIRQRQDRWDEAIVHWQQVARIRALEPTGLLKLAEAQIHQRQWDQARETLEKLDKGWPPRFGDVQSRVRNLHRQIDDKR